MLHYCEDCLTVFPRIPAGSVQAIITDPPYGIGYQSNQGKAGKRFPKIHNDSVTFLEWVQPAANLLSEAGCVLCFSRWDVAGTVAEAFRLAGLAVKSTVVWNKCHHGAGDLRAAFAPQHEIILFAVKKGFRFPGKRPRDVLTVPKVPAAHLRHPCEKPVGLMELLIEAVTKPGDTVLDPFMGVGTTGIAAARLGRVFVGCELDAGYYNIAAERIGSA